MLKLNQISKEFIDGRKNVTKALIDVNVTFPSTGFISIVGKSGSGKSTILNILAGLISPTSGDYYIEDKNTKELSLEDWNLLRDQYFGFIFQNYNLIENATVFENLKIVLLNQEDIERRIDEILSQFDILPLKNKAVEDLSGGEKQRVSIARACLKNSKVILADEPSASLDEENTKIVFSSLKEASKTRLVILVTHDIEFADSYSDSIVKVNYGKIVSNTIEDKEYKEEKLDLKKKKITFKNELYLQKIFCSKQRFRKIFSGFLSVLLCSLLSLCLYFFAFNEDGYEARSLAKTQSNIFISENSNQNISIEKKKDYFDSKYLDKYKDIIFTPTYLDTYSFPERYFDKNQYHDLFKTIIIDNSLEDNEIIPSTNTLAKLRYCQINYETYEDVIGKKIKLFDKEFLIKSVCMLNYDNLSSYDQSLYDDYAKDVTYMNESTLKEFAKLKYYKQSASSSGFHDYFCCNQYFDNYHNIDNIFDAGPIENDNDIILSIDLFYELTEFVINGDTFEEDHAAYLNKPIHISVTTQFGQHIEGDFNLKQIKVEDGYNYYFSNKVLEIPSEVELKEENTYVCDFSKSSSSSTKAFLKELREDKLDIYNVEYSYVQDTISIIKVNERVLKYASYICLMVLVIFTYFFEKLSIKTNSRKIGIGHSIGLSNKEITIIFSLDIIKEAIISSILAFILSVGYICFIDFNKGFDTIILFPFNPLIHIIVLLIYSILSLSIMLVINYRIRKIKILDLMKK